MIRELDRLGSRKLETAPSTPGLAVAEVRTGRRDTTSVRCGRACGTIRDPGGAGGNARVGQERVQIQAVEVEPIRNTPVAAGYGSCTTLAARTTDTPVSSCAT